MEFKSLKNIETGFRQIRLFTLVFLALCAAVTLCAVWMSYRYAEAQREKIYVLDQGKSLMLALSQDLRQNRPVEAREHVRRFHELFFTYGPEKSAIEGNVNRALLMADRSAMSYYKVLMEKGYFNRLIAGGILQTTQVDSVVCDMNAYPYRRLCHAEDRAREHRYRTVARNYLYADRRRAFGRQSAGIPDRKPDGRRKQRPPHL